MEGNIESTVAKYPRVSFAEPDSTSPKDRRQQSRVGLLVGDVFSSWGRLVGLEGVPLFVVRVQRVFA